MLFSSSLQSGKSFLFIAQYLTLQSDKLTTDIDQEFRACSIGKTAIDFNRLWPLKDKEKKNKWIQAAKFHIFIVKKFSCYSLES